MTIALWKEEGGCVVVSMILVLLPATIIRAKQRGGKEAGSGDAHVTSDSILALGNTARAPDVVDQHW